MTLSRVASKLLNEDSRQVLRLILARNLNYSGNRFLVIIQNVTDHISNLQVVWWLYTYTLINDNNTNISSLYEVFERLFNLLYLCIYKVSTMNPKITFVHYIVVAAVLFRNVTNSNKQQSGNCILYRLRAVFIPHFITDHSNQFLICRFYRHD